MRSRYKHLEGRIHFVTSTIVDWIPLFTSDKYYAIIINAIKHYQAEKDLKIYAYVFLDNHFHLVLSCEDLTNMMRSLKRFTATRIIKQIKEDRKSDILEKLKKEKKGYKINSTYQVWQEGFHPKQIISEVMFFQKIEYIHQNPVRKGLVEEVTDWKYSSARYYYLEEEGLIKIERL